MSDYWPCPDCKYPTEITHAKVIGSNEILLALFCGYCEVSYTLNLKHQRSALIWCEEISVPNIIPCPKCKHPAEIVPGGIVLTQYEITCIISCNHCESEYTIIKSQGVGFIWQEELL